MILVSDPGNPEPTRPTGRPAMRGAIAPSLPSWLGVGNTPSRARVYEFTAIFRDYGANGAGATRKPRIRIAGR
jgi:hypothetical protein